MVPLPQVVEGRWVSPRLFGSVNKPLRGEAGEYAALGGPEPVCEKAARWDGKGCPKPNQGRTACGLWGAAAGGSSHWNVAGLLYLSYPTDNFILSKQRPCALIPHGCPLGSSTASPQICVLIL